MFKRFLVSDLFFGGVDLDKGDWVDFKKLAPQDGIYKVKLECGRETAAYFYEDRIAWACKYTRDSSSVWWDKESKCPLYNVTQWKNHTPTFCDPYACS